MKLLLDQGLPRSAVSYLLKQGFSCVHAGDVGLAASSDAIILDYGRKESCVIATLDAGSTLSWRSPALRFLLSFVFASRDFVQNRWRSC
jgi:Domain of unknown function (DUF5615)